MRKTFTTRRTGPLIRAMIAIALLVAPAPLVAHDGPHGPDVLTRIVTAAQTDNQLAITIELTGLGGPIVLTGVSAPGATSPDITPVYVNFAEDALLSTHLNFSSDIPAVFILTLTFGPLGETHIEVVP